MTGTKSRAEAVITLGQRLGDLVAEENALLKARRPSALSALGAEKQRLTQAYEVEVGALKDDKSTLAALAPEILAQLRTTTGYFQDQLEEHRRLVQAARSITEKMLNKIAEHARRGQKPVMNYGRDAVMAPAFRTAATAAPLALDQLV